MKEHPILFSGPMVRAILEGHKTQTRRVVTPRNSVIGEGGDWVKLNFYGKQSWKDARRVLGKPYEAETFVDSGFPNPVTKKKDWQYLHVPYDFEEAGVVYRVYSRYEVGDRLWVKETFNFLQGDGNPNDFGVHYIANDSAIWWADNGQMMDYPIDTRKRPSIFMPRWASRILLEISEVRVQRVQEIIEEDAVAEGLLPAVKEWAGDSARHDYADLWDSINAKRGYSWDSNPFVWAISFRKLESPMTQVRR